MGVGEGQDIVEGQRLRNEGCEWVRERERICVERMDKEIGTGIGGLRGREEELMGKRVLHTEGEGASNS